MSIHEIKFKFDDASKALLVLLEEIRLLDLQHNDLNARAEAAEARVAAGDTQ